MPGRADRPDTLAEAVVQSSLDGLAVLDREGRYTMWNRAMERFAGKTADEVLGRPMLEVFPFLREHGLDLAVARVLAGETVATDGVVNVEPDGARKVYDRLYLPLRSGDGEVTGVVCIVRDATARYVAQDALSRSDAKLRMAADAAGVGLWSWDPKTDVVAWEDTMCSIFGLPPGHAPLGRAEYLAMLHPEDRARSAERIAHGKAAGEWEDEFRILRADGAVRWVMSKARVLHTDGRDVVLGAVFDVTERQERDERRRAAQKLEAVGQLTAGIAHNFNNMLMGLLPNLEVAVRRAPEDLAPLLRSAEHSAQRAADLVRQLVTYAGRNRGAARRAEAIGPLVERTAAFCQTTFDRRIAFTLRCQDAAVAAVDATQLEQALLNLLINARDAVGGLSTASPEVTVSVELVHEGTPELEERAGDWVRVRVEDNGVGMDAATAQRIYEPFFTTKDAGKGTGLGLATTHSIVREHGGFITCRSAPGQGSTFALYLPAARHDAVAANDGGGEEALPLPDPRPATRATILVVDDEAPVRKVVSIMLEDAGFVVRTAASGDEALHVLTQGPRAQEIALVLLDVSMPGMPAPLLRSRLRELAPRARVVYLTGYPYESTEGDTVLEKPLSERRLVSALHAVLAAAH